MFFQKTVKNFDPNKKKEVVCKLCIFLFICYYRSLLGKSERKMRSPKLDQIFFVDGDTSCWPCHEGYLEWGKVRLELCGVRYPLHSRQLARNAYCTCVSLGSQIGCSSVRDPVAVTAERCTSLVQWKVVGQCLEIISVSKGILERQLNPGYLFT